MKQQETAINILMDAMTLVLTQDQMTQLAPHMHLALVTERRQILDAYEDGKKAVVKVQLDDELEDYYKTKYGK